MNGYLVLVDGSRYVVQAEIAAQAEQRVRNAIDALGENVHVSRQLTDAELTCLQLTLGEVRLEPAEHG